MDLIRRHRAANARSRTYRVARWSLLSFVGAYILLLSFPRILFAHELTYRSFTVLSREPLDHDVFVVLDRADARLSASALATAGQYFRFYMVVKYLLEHDKITVDELFSREFDFDALCGTVLKML
jgi:hypothetical protein